MLGVIGGTVFLKHNILKPKTEKIKTVQGTALIQKTNSIVFIPRHGFPAKIPPHKINHKANILALKKMGVKEIIGVNSVGSLKKEIKPGTIAVPNDYINLFNVQTFFDKEIKHITPALSAMLRKKLLNATKKLNINVLNKGVYFQSLGPRLETPAESRFASRIADFVGMTMASEATLAKELELEYAAICSVDNYANGIAGKAIHSSIVKNASLNAEKIWQIIEKTADQK